MKKILALLSAFVLTLSLSGCFKGGSETIFDAIKLSSAAKMELPDGSFMYVDSEISGGCVGRGRGDPGLLNNSPGIKYGKSGLRDGSTGRF